MSAPDKKNLSPFGLAALALDAEFVERCFRSLLLVTCPYLILTKALVPDL